MSASAAVAVNIESAASKARYVFMVANVECPRISLNFFSMENTIHACPICASSVPVIMRPKLKTGAFILAGLLCLWPLAAPADDFTNDLNQAAAAVKAGNTRHALDIYQKAQTAAAGNAAELCVLSRRYSDLMHQTPFLAAQRDLLARALACAQDAVKAEPKNPLAHVSVAVCYAKECQFADTKTSLIDSRLFK